MEPIGLLSHLVASVQAVSNLEDGTEDLLEVLILNDLIKCIEHNLLLTFDAFYPLFELHLE